MKKYFLFIFLFLLSSSALATNSLITKEPCNIIKQDYMQDYIEYNCEFINFTTYKIIYEIKDEVFFDIIEQCEINDDDCFDNLVIKKNNSGIKVKDIIENKKSIFGIGEKYSYNDFIETYLNKKSKKDKDKDIENLKKDRKFPIESLKGSFSLTKNINPFLKKGDTIINFKNYNESYKLKVGYGSIIIEFNNSLETEILDMYYSNGFSINNYTRYIDIFKFSIINSSSIKIMGIESSKAPFLEYDYFENERDLTRWSNDSYQEFDGASVCSHASNTDGNFRMDLIGQKNDPCNGNYEGWNYVQTNSTEINFALSENFAFLINYSYNNYVDVNSGGVIGISSTNASLINQDGSLLKNIGFHQITSGPAEDFGVAVSGSEFLKIIYNTTENKLKIYNHTGELLSDTSISGTNNVYLRFQVYGRKQEGCTGSNSCKATSDGDLWVNLIGYSKDIVNVINYNSSQNSFPEEFEFIIGDNLTYNKVGSLSDTIQVNFSDEIYNILNDGCICSDCYSEEESCIIPFNFYAENGGQLNYSNINITYDPVATNITVNLYDILKDVKINFTNMTVQVVGDQYQTQTITESGNATIIFSFSSPVPDEVFIRVFGTDTEDYQLTEKQLTIESNQQYSVDVFLLNKSDTTKTKQVTLNVINQYGSNVENAVIHIFANDPDTNSDISVGDYTTDSDGEVSVYFVIDKVKYNFNIDFFDQRIYTGNEAKSIPSTKTALTFQGIIGDSYSEFYNNYYDVTLIINPKISGGTGYFEYNYVSQSAPITICTHTYLMNFTKKTFNGTVCDYGTNGVFNSLTYEPSNVTKYCTEVFFNNSLTNSSFIGSSCAKFGTESSFKTEYREQFDFLLLIPPLALFLFFVDIELIAILLVGLGYFFIYLTGLTLLTLTHLGFILTFCIVAMITIYKNK